MDKGFDIPFWIWDAFYLELSLGERYYVCHDNAIVYDEDDRPIEVWRLKGRTGYIIPTKRCPEIVRKAYMVATTPSHYVGHPKLKRNGLEVDLPSNTATHHPWFRVWTHTYLWFPPRLEVELPERHIDLLDVKPRSGIFRNTTIFSVDGLYAATYYDDNLEKIRDIADINYDRPVTREYRKLVSKLPDDFPRRRWDPKIKVDNLHFGQLKLLLAEIEFLTGVTSQRPGEQILVLYPGGGPGDHVPLLSQMFPECYFVLIDPVFDSESHTVKIVPDEKIIIRAEYFEKQYMELFQGWSNVAMISDIRSTPPESLKPKRGDKDYQTKNKLYETEFDRKIVFDMDLQRSWVETLRSASSLLKFRLLYGDQKTPYLCGDLYFQAFPPETSSELRLVPSTPQPTVCQYDNTKIEEQLFYFNTMYRNQSFYDIHPLFGKSYDTIREAKILQDFLELRGIEATAKHVYNMMGMIDEFFGREQITRLLLR